jgi:tRNA (guanine-N7-)-methyltransferase
MLPQLRPELGDGPLNAVKIFGRSAPLFLEIGFGAAEHLVARASERPEHLFIGCEPFRGGVAKLCAAIDRLSLTNIAIHDDDAWQILETLAPGALAGVYQLFPDPWPKKRHHKRRFVAPATLVALTRALAPGGFYRLASDDEDYANWTLAHVLRQPDLDWEQLPPGSWRRPWPDHFPTRYELKALADGRTPFYFQFVRTLEAGRTSSGSGSL